MAERIVTIHQPQYLPWLGLVQKIYDSDVFVVLDTVPYSRNYFYNRNRVRTAQGWTWLTIPVLTKGKLGQPFSEVAICDDTDWRKKHWATLRQSYAKAPHFRAYELSLAEFYTRPYARLLDAACDSMRLTLNLLGVEREILLASQLPVSGTKDELLLAICRHLGATTYLSGPDGRDYLREEPFTAAGIAVRYHDYRHPVYPQHHGAFLTQMAALDLLCNCGAASIRYLQEPPAETAPLMLEEEGKE